METNIVITKKQLIKLLHIATGNIKDFVMDNEVFVDEQLKAIKNK